MPQFRRRGVRRATKQAFRCAGGPLEGHWLWLTSGSTLPFSLKGQQGLYSRRCGGNIMEWEEDKKRD